ncbi:MAG: DUF5050 domain-containing protein [Actinobacteria bacterium]|nr:DUF5050 domain-containing protein [Actinomycetota bacterium]
MKVVTVILIILFASVAIFFSVMLVKKTVNSKKGSSESTQESQSETTTAGETIVETTGVSVPETSAETSTGTTAEPSKNITDIEIYLDGDRAAGIFLGQARINQPSKDAEAIYGKNLENSGFQLKVENKNFNFEPGTTHNLYIYTFIPAYGWEYAKQEITVPGNPTVASGIRMSLDSITDNSVISSGSLKELTISGWAADTSAAGNTGIDKVEVYVDGPRNFGKLIGVAAYGLERTDVGNALGNANYNNSGYSINFDASALEAGSSHKIYVYAYSPNGTYQYITKNIIIEGNAKVLNSMVSVNAVFGTGSIEVTGWAVTKASLENVTPPDTNKDYAIKKIVFVSNKTGNEDIFSMNLDGSELTQLTNDPGTDQYPAVSPDGKKIAYSADVKGNWQIIVMDWDGKNKKQITFEPARHGFPSWSFDGRYIFFEMSVDNNWEIYRMNSDGTDIHRLTLTPGIDNWHPSAHPFEYKVLFEVGSSGEGGINIIDYDGQNLKKISKPGGNYRVPKMSMDGKKIVFMGYSGNKKPDVYMIDSDGGNLVQLTDSPEGAGLPCFSPDDKFIAYDQVVEGNEEIFIMNADGSNQTRITNIPGADWGAAFLYQVK